MAPMGADKSAECYGAGDLRLGMSIDIHGRTFWLYDCDAFTRQYCQAHGRRNAASLAPCPADDSRNCIC